MSMKLLSRAKAENSLGQKFGRITIIEITKKRIRRHVAVKCLCDCGGEGIFDLSQIKAGRINSCGCLQKEASVDHIKNAHKVMFETGKWQREPRMGTAVNVYKNRHNYNDGDISFEEFLELTQQNCHYCGVGPSNVSNSYISYSRRFEFYKEERIRDGYFTYNGLDRVNNNFPHNKNNVVPCCWLCNRMKGNMSYDEFKAHIARIFDFSVKDKVKFQ